MRIEAFTRYNEMTGDAYVMDYTQATAGKRKVCIKEEDPDDIASYRQYKFTVGFHCIRYCLPVWSDRGDFVCEAVTQDYAGGSG